MKSFPTLRQAAVIVSLVALSACATTTPRTAPLAADAMVRSFDLDYANVPPAPADVSPQVGAAWSSLRAGNAAAAAQALAASADGESAGRRTVEGFLALSRRDAAVARTRFQQALAQETTYATALYGLGAVSEAQGNRTAGLDWYRQALQADPSLFAAAVRARVMELEEAQVLIGSGALAEAAGDDRAALAAYESARALGPDVLDPYLRIAAIDARQGRSEEAVRTLRTARSRIGELRLILEPLGRLLQDSGQYADAYDVYQALENIAPDDPDVRALVAVARELYFTTSLPEQYRQLEQKPEIVRADLAALLAIRLPNLGERVATSRDGVIITDIADSWAEDYILQVVEWAVMQVFQNHAFSPDIVVKRQMFAEVAYRVLEILDAVDGVPSIRLSDVSSEHYFYDEIKVVVGKGILPVGPRGGFGILDAVSGEEAVAAVQRLVRIARNQDD